MQKKGAVSWFVLLGIVAVTIFFFLDYVGETAVEENPGAQLPVKNFVEQCITDTLEEAIFTTSIRGGNYYLPDHSKPLSFDYSTIHYDKGVNKVPSLANWEEQIAFYVEDNVNNCLQDFQDFPTEVTFGDFFALVGIYPDQVTLTADFPVEMQGNKYTEFSASVPSRLEEIHEIGVGLVEAYSSDRLYLNLDRSLELMAWHDVQIDHEVFPDDGTIIYYVYDNYTIVDDLPLLYRFLVTFDNSNTAPKIVEFPTLRVKRDTEFSYQFNAIDQQKDVLTYSIDPNDYYISPSGLLTGTPTVPGQFYYTLTVSDGDVESTKQVVIRVDP